MGKLNLPSNLVFIFLVCLMAAHLEVCYCRDWILLLPVSGGQRITISGIVLFDGRLWRRAESSRSKCETAC